MPVKDTHFEQIPIDRIYVGRGVTRTRGTDSALDGLIKCIKRYGLLSPLIVSQKDNKYELVVGLRRFLAVRTLGWKKVPAMIMGHLETSESKVLSLIDNIQRRDLSYLDLRDAIEALYMKYGSTKAIADELGISETTVQNCLPLSFAPEPIKGMIKEKKITASEAKQILIICGDNEKKMLAIAREIQNLTEPEKRRLFDIAEEKPNASSEKLIKEARKPPVETKIVIHLSPEFKRAIDKTAKDLGMSIDNIFMSVIQDWLASKGYMKKEA